LIYETEHEFVQRQTRRPLYVTEVEAFFHVVKEFGNLEVQYYQ